jgi:8-oxo-dGTP pyrophosphatase MutT (NUDIX family)
MEKIAVRAIILDRKGNVLLGKRARGTLAEKWALIGGKPDQDETEEQTVKREVCEEIGGEFTNLVFWKKELQEAVTPGDFLRESYYFGNITADTEKLILNPTETLEVKYFSRIDLDNFEVVPIHDKILREFFNRKR